MGNSRTSDIKGALQAILLHSVSDNIPQDKDTIAPKTRTHCTGKCIL